MSRGTRTIPSAHGNESGDEDEFVDARERSGIARDGLSAYDGSMPRDSTQVLLDTIDHVYAAVFEPARWSDALSGLTSLLEARAAGLRIETVGVRVEQHWVGLDAAFDQAYVAHYWKDDPWAVPARTADAGAVMCGDGITPRRLVEASAFHNELALPNGFDDLAGAVLERTPTRLVSLGVMGVVGRRFGARDLQTLKRIAPHVRHALLLTERLAGTPAQDAGPSPRVEELLVRRYQLTAAEVRVAMCVGRGLSPKEAAIELGVSWHTIRAQLRQIYAKTETRSQRALARLVTLAETSVATEAARAAMGR